MGGGESRQYASREGWPLVSVRVNAWQFMTDPSAQEAEDALPSEHSVVGPGSVVLHAQDETVPVVFAGCDAGINLKDNSRS